MVGKKENQKKIARRNKHRGTDFEHHTAKVTNGVRIGDRGFADVETALHRIECKTVAKLPPKLDDFMSQTIANARNKTPLLIIHKNGDQHDNDLVVLRLCDAIKMGMFIVKSGMERLEIELDLVGQ